MYGSFYKHNQGFWFSMIKIKEVNLLPCGQAWREKGQMAKAVTGGVK